MVGRKEDGIDKWRTTLEGDELPIQINKADLVLRTRDKWRKNKQLVCGRTPNDANKIRSYFPQVVDTKMKQ